MGEPHKRGWTAEQDDQLLKMMVGGMMQKDIAVQVNRSAAIICYRVQVLQNRGLLPKKDRRGKRRRPYIQKPQSPETSERKMRKCLGWCGRKFMSEWSGHRICPECASTVNRRANDCDGYALHAP